MTLAITMSEFFSQAMQSPALLITALLTLGVILVNGWTDAPNAIATAIATRAIRPKPAILMAAVMNFLGVFIWTKISPGVAESITEMVNFKGDTNQALVALCAALVAIVVWATAAWAFGIPTSESHALIAGLSGAAIALQGGMGGINMTEWIRVIYGIFLSTMIGFVGGFIIVRLIEFIFRNADRRKTHGFFGGAQVFAASTMAFMHGAQDGQKFMGVFLLGISLAQGVSGASFQIPVWLMILCSVVMALGTALGGEKIIKTVGMDMVSLNRHEGFAADIAATISLIISTVSKLPVSTTHTKTTAIMGVGASRGISKVNWDVAKEMILAWVLTFPGCGIIGFVMAKIFLQIF